MSTQPSPFRTARYRNYSDLSIPQSSLNLVHGLPYRIVSIRPQRRTDRNVDLLPAMFIEVNILQDLGFASSIHGHARTFSVSAFVQIGYSVTASKTLA